MFEFLRMWKNYVLKNKCLNTYPALRKLFTYLNRMYRTCYYMRNNYCHLFSNVVEFTVLDDYA